MEEKWIKAGEEPPKVAQMAFVFSCSLGENMGIKAVVTKNPFADDEYIYWHFINPRTGDMQWTRIMADDRWMPFHDIKPFEDENEVQEL